MKKPAAVQDETGELREFAIEAARLIADRHCEDVRLLDVRGLSQVCDYVLIGTGTSDRQMKSLADELADFGGEHDQPIFRTDRDTNTTWVVVDFVGLVTHLFEPELRTHYDLEGLWSDAEPIRWQRKPAGRS